MKRYTAQEMRDMADLFDYGMTAEMLRQAADYMERESKRERKYEYAVEFRFKPKGWWHELARYDDFKTANEIMIDNRCKSLDVEIMAKYWRVVRREVGEWEEVGDEEN